MLHPDDSVKIRNISTGVTNAEFHIGNLTPEVLRDIARNESAAREWRKAAVKFLLDRGHEYANHRDLSEILAEIKSEREAEDEVRAVVESAIEAPFNEA